MDEETRKKEMEEFAQNLMEIFRKRGKQPDERKVAEFAESFLYLLDDTEE